MYGHLPHLLFRPLAFDALVKLFSEPQHLQKSKTDDDPDAGITEIDYEEQTAGYQAAYSRLAAAESAPVDPVAAVTSLPAYVGQELAQLRQREPRVAAWVAATDASVTGPFVAAMQGAGFVIA